MNKLKYAIAIAVVALPSVAFADASEERQVEPFTRVSLDGMLDAKIEVGGEQSVVLVVNKERYLEDITTRVRGDTLIVETDIDTNIFTLFKNIEVEVRITVPTLAGVDLDGLGDITITGIDSEEFDLSLDGMGSVDIVGSCGSADIKLDGMGDLNARGFECRSVRLVVDGMGDADIFASEYADVTLDGMGDIDIYGNPERTKLSEDGMGDIDVK